MESPTREYICTGGALIATHEGAAAKFHYADHLSARVTSDSAGANRIEQGHYPFGESWYEGSGATKWKFTSYERDAESGNDYAVFRTYVNRLGRFCSPDPVQGSASNPQSLNRYAYALNDPVDLVDPLGLEPKWVCVQGCVTTYDRDGRPHTTCDGIWDCRWEDSDPEWRFLFISLRQIDDLRGKLTERVRGELKKLKSAACAAVPEGRSVGVSQSMGATGGVTGSAEVVLNYNTGETSLFFAGGAFGGWNGGATASVGTSYLFNLGESNANYSGGFTTVSGGGTVGGQISQSSDGLAGPANLNFNGVTAIGVSASVSAVGTRIGGVAATNYSQPIPLGRLGSVLAFASSPLDAANLLTRQLCR